MRKIIGIVALFASISLTACTEDYGSTQSPIAYSDCTLTQGYWKNHPQQWPVSTLTLGSVKYTKSQALAVFNQPVDSNGLVSLAHQLMASKLNVAAGSTNTVTAEIASADAKIGALVVPSVGAGRLTTTVTSSLVQALDQYNIGATGPEHCDGVGAPECYCGDGAIHSGEQCDDGNQTNGDGCSSTCQRELIL